jgi:hypothetical protein
MGSNSSKENYFKAQQELRTRATINYDRRLREYKFSHHGYYINYLEWCRDQYERECMPEYCRKNSEKINCFYN